MGRRSRRKALGRAARNRGGHDARRAWAEGSPLRAAFLAAVPASVRGVAKAALEAAEACAWEGDGCATAFLAGVLALRGDALADVLAAWVQRGIVSWPCLEQLGVVNSIALDPRAAPDGRREMWEAWADLLDGPGVYA